MRAWAPKRPWSAPAADSEVWLGSGGGHKAGPLQLGSGHLLELGGGGGGGEFVLGEVGEVSEGLGAEEALERPRRRQRLGRRQPERLAELGREDRREGRGGRGGGKGGQSGHRKGGGKGRG